MNFVKKYYCVFTLILHISVSANGIQETLKNYPNNPEKISSAARSIIIHYFQKGAIDSIDMVISFCDTLTTLNREWLSGHERILIELLKGNIDSLKRPDFFKNHLSLADTADVEVIITRPPRYDPYRHTIPHHDNLSPFLLQNYRQKVTVFKNRYPEEVLLWEFLDIIFDCTQKKVIQYLVNYPNSPYHNLVLYNYFIRYTYRHHGIMGGMGYSFINFGKEPNLLFQDKIAFHGFVDMYLRGFAITVSLSVATKGAKSNLIVNEDTVFTGTSYRDIFFETAVGHIISIRDRVYITPFVGVGGFHTSPLVRKDFSLPAVIGVKAGFSSHFRIAFYDTEFISSTPKPDLAIRLEVGYRYNKFYRIRSDLGTDSFYITLALELIKFGFQRSFSVH